MLACYSQMVHIIKASLSNVLTGMHADQAENEGSDEAEKDEDDSYKAEPSEELEADDYL